jgi:hypothetical protein
VVTIATDGFDRYPSVMDDLERRCLETGESVLRRWAKDIFLRKDTENIYDLRAMAGKEQLFHRKEQDWLPFGYSREYLDSMRRPEFWEEEYTKVEEYDQKIKSMR